MFGHIVSRLLIGGLTLLSVITLTFFLLRALPGGPFQNPKVPPAIQQQLAAQYQLDKPLLVQYKHYLGQLLQGKLGPSLISPTRSVNDMILQGFGYSFLLGFLALVVGLGLSIPLGTLAGLRINSLIDHLLSFLGFASLSMPAFVLGGLLVFLFSLTLQWLPAATLQSPAHYCLPVLTLAMTPFAYGLLLTRTSVQEKSLLPHVSIKRSFGIPPQNIELRHILRNALIPLLSILGPLVATLMTGSFAVEYIFAIPGLGKYFVNGVLSRDYTLVMGITILYSTLLIALNMVTDIMLGWADPRIQQSSSS